MDKLRVGITIGDLNGIGLEVILKTLSNPGITNLCTPIIFGSTKVVSYHKNIVNLENFPFTSIQHLDQIRDNKINILNCWSENVNITLGKKSEHGGKFAFQSLEAGVEALKNSKIQALVTAPIHKASMQDAGFEFPGHSEYLTAAFEMNDHLMLMVNDNLRVAVATGHIPLAEVAGEISKKLVSYKLRLLHDTLVKDFGIERPVIAILGLNPHAGEQGMLGQQEDDQIRPAIIEAKKNGILAMGPFSADGFFGSSSYKKYDGILAMYHDQGLIPFKTLSFGNGVNYTAGLPFVRTSPDHGTAFEIAGKNMADPSSFRQALFLAMDIARSRINYADMRENQLTKKSKLTSENPNA